MSLYRVTPQKLESVSRTSFSAENVFERKDLQRLLHNDISPLGDDLMVIAEEFGEWEESSRRIDLLCLSKARDVVVVEIKRTEDGGHMELQAIRYAAMVSSMTLDQAISVYARFSAGDADTARKEVLAFLELDTSEEAELTGKVRIVLVAADFSTELTGSVLWLNRHELDITCFRLRPYRIGDQLLIDATRIIPLPETEDYEIKLRAQEREKRKVLTKRNEIFEKFWTQLISRAEGQTSLFANRSPSTGHWLSAAVGRSGFSLACVLTQHESQVECYIRIGDDEEKSESAFRQLLARKDQIESAFGDSLEWQDLPERLGCRICRKLSGGWKSPETDWPDLQQRLIVGVVKLEAALRKPVQEVKL